MRKSQFSVEQVVAVREEARLGMPVRGLARQLGISEQTSYRWKNLYSGLRHDQARELKQLRAENARMKKLVVGLSLAKAILQDVGPCPDIAHLLGSSACSTSTPSVASVSAS